MFTRHSGKDKKSSTLFEIYDTKLKGSITKGLLGQILDDIYYSVIYSLPYVCDKGDALFPRVLDTQENMKQRFSVEKRNLQRVAFDLNQSLSKSDFIKLFSNNTYDLFNVQALRYRVSPVMPGFVLEIPKKTLKKDGGR